MSWVNLDDVYVNKTGDSIAGNLSVNGALTVNDGKGTNTTYNVANEITTLRDSVSQRGVVTMTTNINDNVVQVKFNTPIETDYVVITSLQFPKFETWGWPSVTEMVYNKTSTGFTMDVWNSHQEYQHVQCTINWIAIPLQHSVSHDYIVAQGTSGIWFYRKWNSGLAEFWGGKEIKGIGSVTAPAVDFPFPLTSLLYKGASAIYSSGQKGVYVLSGTGASIGLVNTGVYVLNQDIKDNNTTTVAFIEYNVKGMWK